MTEIGYYLYENATIDTKIKWLENAAGARATEDARVGTGNLGNRFVTSDQAVRDLLRPLGIAWNGRAADAAAQALHRTADRGGTVGSASSAGSGSVDTYGQSFETLRSRFPLRQPGPVSWWGGVRDVASFALSSTVGTTFGVQSDYMRTVEANRTAEAEANRALRQHERAAQAALTAFPTLAPAAAPTTDTAAGGGGGHVGGLGGGSGNQGGTPGHEALPTPHPGGGGRGPQSTVPPPMITPPGPGLVPQPGGPIRTPGGGSDDLPDPRPRTDIEPARVSPDGPSTGNGSGGYPTPDRGGTPPGPGRRGTDPPGGFPPPTTGWDRPAPGPGGNGGRYGNGGSGGRTGTGGYGSGGRAGTGGYSSGGRTGTGGYGSRPGSWGSATGPEFGERFAPGSTGSSGAAGSGRAGAGQTPLLGGLGGGAGSGSTTHKRKYWIPSSEAFDVPLPPHTDPVIEGIDE